MIGGSYLALFRMRCGCYSGFCYFLLLPVEDFPVGIAVYDEDVGIVVVDSAVLASLPDRLRSQLSGSVSPTVLGIGTDEDNTLRETIRRAIGVDLWK